MLIVVETDEEILLDSLRLRDELADVEALKLAVVVNVVEMLKLGDVEALRLAVLDRLLLADVVTDVDWLILADVVPDLDADEDIVVLALDTTVVEADTDGLELTETDFVVVPDMETVVD